jgi:hypothetical protein
LEHYVTLFDSLFAPQGLALHASLQRHAGPFTLWVLCMDEEVRRQLDRLGEPTLRTIALADVETPQLLEVKPGRSRAEYCWTMTPFTPQMVFDRAADAERVTYIDADVFLFKSPKPIFDEFAASGKAVLITDHAYDPEYDQSALSGQYCVQFVTFVRGRCEPVRRWWQDRCLEWCFARVENGKLGDQKYLDEWPTRFGDLVHVLTQLDVLLAPWNARRFPYSRAIAWHFHSLRLLPQGRVLLHAGYAIPAVVDDAIYSPYIEQLANSLQILGGPVVQKVKRRGPVLLLKSFTKNLLLLLRNLGEHDAIRRLPK